MQQWSIEQQAVNLVITLIPIYF